jgi:hypothetical protein
VTQIVANIFEEVPGVLGDNAGGSLDSFGGNLRIL